MATLREWFGLKEGRRSFVVEPSRDGNLLFCHQQTVEKLVELIRFAFATEQPLKALVVGDYGIGKTHTLRYLQHWFSAHATDYPAKPVYAEFGDVNRKSRFDVLQRHLLDQISLNEVIRLVHSFLRADRHLDQLLVEIGVSADVSTAFTQFLGVVPGNPPTDAARGAWDFLRGASVAKRVSLAVTDSQIMESRDFISVLKVIGELYQRVDQEWLVFLVDEANKLDETEDDAPTAAHWRSAHRMIYDIENLSFGWIYTAAVVQDQLPYTLERPEVYDRITVQRHLTLYSVPAQSISNYLSRMRDSIVDYDLVREVQKAGELNSDFQWETYPYTKSAFESVVAYWERNAELATPRSLSENLQIQAYVAMKNGKRLIDDDVMVKTSMAVGED